MARMTPASRADSRRMSTGSRWTASGGRRNRIFAEDGYAAGGQAEGIGGLPGQQVEAGRRDGNRLRGVVEREEPGGAVLAVAPADRDPRRHTGQDRADAGR